MSKKLWTQEEVNRLLKDAEHNNGHCSNCWQKIAVYRYTANKQMAIILRRMAAATHETGKTAIDVDTLGLAHSQRTQLTKMRFHGLVAKVKDKDGHQIARNWLVTTKGWNWLKGEPVERVVVTFDNQLLGHEGGTVTITEALGEKPAQQHYEEQPITEVEAGVYHDVRQPHKMAKVQALYKVSNYTNKPPIKGQVYDVEIDKLQMGKPVNISVFEKGLLVFQAEYKDIAAFMQKWQIVKQ